MLKTLLSILGIYKLYEKWLGYQVKNSVKPEHIAIILDGNRRWALAQSLRTLVGHQKGAKKVEQLLDWCLNLGVKSVTLYAFSTENFRRSKREVEEVFQVVEEKLRELLDSEAIHEHKVRVKVIGRVNLLPENLQSLIKDLESTTKSYDELFLNVALAYGGRAEIVDAAKKISKKVQQGELTPEEVDERLFEKYLYTAHLSKQDPDLIIRTSGEERMSGFLLWQSAYSELCFLEVFWPDFRRIDFLRAIRTYQLRKRRFGQ
jgi:tritrans,polycis-undecaprenyl-diphosphate synthase [geranylgeranyl-diphosphate specific]